MFEVLLLFVGMLVGSLAAITVLLPRLRAARAAAGLAEGELTSALRARQDLQEELDAVRAALEAQNAEVGSQNAELRRRLDEVAELLLRQGDAAAVQPSREPAPNSLSAFPTRQGEH